MKIKWCTPCYKTLPGTSCPTQRKFLPKTTRLNYLLISLSMYSLILHMVYNLTFLVKISLERCQFTIISTNISNGLFSVRNFVMCIVHPYWKKSSNQTYSCPRDWRLTPQCDSVGMYRGFQGRPPIGTP